MKTQTVLVTGANKGIGLEVVRLLAGAGYHVFLGSRDKEKGEAAVRQLTVEGGGRIELVVVDVSSESSVREAAAWLGQRIDRLDVLVNNAGIRGSVPQTPSDADDDNMHRVFETNFFGAVRMVRHFMELLRKSELPRIVNVTSDLASLTLHNDPQWRYYTVKGAAYGPSKTALNAYTVALAYELRDKGFKVNAVNPGYTSTEFNNFQGYKKVGEAAGLVAEYAQLDKNGPTGRFVSDYGESPW
ncbi:MAG: SDR family NAD(P)-dependent oxidoreductase [Bacteroidetes bacterium]|nr:SDR family NAD(P)-dependent oxidoreductase [Bacteroidota bacterium]